MLGIRLTKMKKAISVPVMIGVVVVALIVIGALFIKFTGDPEPTAKNLPDYTKMKPEEIMAAHDQEAKAEREALSKVGR